MPKTEARIKGVLIKLEDLENRSVRLTLIFKKVIQEKNELAWEDTARVLGQCISEELDMNYTYEEIHKFISRAHRSSEDSSKSQYKEKRPLLV